MNEKHFPKGSIIARQGDRTDSIVMVQKGTILIYQKIVKATKRYNTSTSSNSVITSVGKDQCGGEVVIDIAKIGSHDVFGIVEAVTKSKKMKREAVAYTDVGAFLIQ
jgi:CRP-like cAMP-binding protein